MFLTVRGSKFHTFSEAATKKNAVRNAPVTDKSAIYRYERPSIIVLINVLKSFLHFYENEMAVNRQLSRSHRSVICIT